MKVPLSRILAVMCSVSIFCVSAQIYAHSGGTDGYGCHSGSESYHCHDESDQIPTAGIVLAVVSVVSIFGFIWYVSTPPFNPTPISSDLEEDDPSPPPSSDISSGVLFRF